MGGKNKIALIKLKQIFLEETDEDNWLDLEELREKLIGYMESEHNVVLGKNYDITKRTIKTYMKELAETGLDIISRSEKYGKKVYSHQDKIFNNTELMMIINALNSFKFLCEEDTEKIKSKIKLISSKNTFRKFEKVIQCDPKLKVKNPKIKYKINEIASALLNGRVINFKYKKYGLEEGRVVKVSKYDGKKYEVDPYGVTLHSGKMYMIGRDRQSDIVKNYRVDMMGEVLEGDSEIQSHEFNLNEHLNRSMSMFGGGELIKLQLRTHISSVRNLKDHFGQDIYIDKVEGEHIVTTHKVYNNSGLVSTLLRFGKKIQVLYPQCVRTKLKEKAEELISIYRDS